MMTSELTVTPLAAALGAEIDGIDLGAELDDETVERLEGLLHTHLVLFFRDQHLDVARAKAFAARFGELHIHPVRQELADQGHPEVLVQHTGVQRPYVPSKWHSDVTFSRNPPKAALLRAVTIPPVGGDTMWASMYAAYDALSPTMRAMIDGLEAVHDGGRLRNVARTDAQRDDYDRDRKAVHPVARTHPVTGRKALFVNRVFTRRIVGLTDAESRAVLEFLFEHIGNPDFTCRFKWTEGALALWDQRCTTHRVVADNVLADRLVQRFTILERGSI